jgi:hypothetical protein
MAIRRFKAKLDAHMETMPSIVFTIESILFQNESLLIAKQNDSFFVLFRSVLESNAHSFDKLQLNTRISCTHYKCIDTATTYCLLYAILAENSHS